jgi:hypothetical protein
MATRTKIKKKTTTRGGARKTTASLSVAKKSPVRGAAHKKIVAAPRFQNMRFDREILDLLRNDIIEATSTVEKPLSVRSFIEENFDTLVIMRRGNHTWPGIFDIINRRPEARGMFTARTMQIYFNQIADERGINVIEGVERRGPKRRKQRP